MPELKSRFRRVMVIDDNQIDLYIAGKIIAKHQFSEIVMSFQSAKAALSYLEQHQDEPLELPEIIFVDIYMPVMSGFEFLNAYADLPQGLKQNCRVYVVSSSIDEHDIIQVNKNEDVAGFGVKPMATNFLDTIITRQESA